MREILFRGKRVDNGEWVEGSLIHQTKFYGDPVDHYHILYDGEFHIDYYGSAEVIPETVGQFTGLLDKNGKKIFEGDIIRFGDIMGIINYSTGCYCVKTNKPDWRSRNNPAIDIVLNEYPNEICVIGNIYDNPKLWR